jgi:16S rRNA (cytidine1402-2'-O)-methyltransferase
MAAVNPGILYVVATPLGNRDDITLRALNVLREVDLIAAEDTRKTRSLLTLHSISNNLISYHEHNEAERTPNLIDKLEKGLSMALVSNAGTPMISDPGYRLMEAALGNQLTVIPIPGVSAATTALSVAGLPTDSFTFVGFLSKKKARRQRQINELASVPRTLIFYESPRRIAALLTEITNIMGNRRGVLAREMTKLHEEFIRGLLSEISDRLADRKDIRGECTLLVAGNDSDTDPSWPEVKQEIEAAVAAGQKSLSAIARDIASTAGIAKNRIYAEALKISKELDSG